MSPQPKQSGCCVVPHSAILRLRGSHLMQVRVTHRIPHVYCLKIKSAPRWCIAISLEHCTVFLYYPRIEPFVQFDESFLPSSFLHVVQYAHIWSSCLIVAFDDSVSAFLFLQQSH